MDKANDVCAQSPTNAQGVNAPVAGSLRVQQRCGDNDERDMIDTREQQQHLDDAISVA